MKAFVGKPVHYRKACADGGLGNPKEEEEI
jgi:hypothetical protein